MRFPFLTCSAFLLAFPALTQELAPLEVRVKTAVDGDTIDVASGRALVRLELADIDCPELDQPFGPEAKEAVRELVLGKTVQVRAVGRNQFGQFYALVLLEDGRRLSEELVSRGFAWWKSDTSHNSELGELELQARLEKRGLWSDPEPITPWDWRYRAASRTMREAEEIGRTTPSSTEHPCIPRSQCCKVCSTGKACGASCISVNYTCRVGRGCACDASEVC